MRTDLKYFAIAHRITCHAENFSNSLKEIIILRTKMRAFLSALLCLCLASLAASRSFVTDGGFESIPSSDADNFNFTAGAWSFEYECTLGINQQNDPDNTP